MAEPTFLLAAAFGPQAVRGTVDPTIAALTGALGVADGLVLGDPESGIGASGITARFLRELREKARVTGSFTRQPSDFLGRKLDGFEITFPFRGSGETVPGAPADADATLHKGPDALLRACGWTPANWGSGVGRIYTPASAELASAKLWLFDTAGNQALAVVLKDLVGDPSLKFTPGGLGFLTAALGGVIDSAAIVTTPTFSYGTQGTVSSPVVENVGHRWGIGGVQRGFSGDFTLTVSNELEDVSDSNAPSGKRTRQTDRLIEFEATIFSDDGDLDFEYTELGRTTIATDELYFTVGSPMATGQPALAYRVRLPTPEVHSIEPAKGGDSGAWTVKGSARGATAGSEAQLIFL